MSKVLIAFLLFVICVLYYALFKVDVSGMPVVDRAQLPSWAKDKQVVLVCYGDGPEVFKKNQNILTGSAVGKGVDVILSYKKEHLSSSFVAKNKHILDQKRGAGYWLWKPYVILEAMEKHPEDSIIIYADSGVIFAKHLYPLLQHLNDHDIIVAGFTQHVPLGKHIKKEALRALKIENDQAILNAPHYWGAFMIFRNSDKNRALVKKWLSYCEIAEALTDIPLDPAIQDPAFGAHEHDQSLLGIVMAQEKPNFIKLSRKELIRDYGVTNYHRHPEQEAASPLFQIAGFPVWLSKVLYDNALMNTLRGWVTKG